MDKLAQKRSLRSKIWENVNLTGKALEGLHPEFKELMVSMRKTDKAIRDAADDVKPAVRYARSALRQRDYLNAAHFVTAFHQRLRFVAHHLNIFLQNVDVDHFNYLLKNFKNRHNNQIFEYDPNAEIKEACQQFDALTKEAGVYDWLKDKALHVYDFTTDTASNIITNKGRSRRLMEKRFNIGFMKDLKEETTGMVEESMSMLKDLLRILSELESGVSRRNPGAYIEGAKDFIKMFNDYHKKYEKFHAKIVIPLKEFKAKADKEEAAQRQAIEEQKEMAARQEAEQHAARERAEMEAAENNVFVSPHRFIPQESPASQYSEPSFEQWQKAPGKEENQEALNRLEENDKQNPFAIEESAKPAQEPKEERKNPKAPLSLKVQPQQETELEKALKQEVLKEEEAPSSKAAGHNPFVEQLSVFAQEDDIKGFVQEILDYSEMIEDTDPEQSIELLSIAQEILANEKTAGLWDRIRGKKDPKESPKQQEFQRGPQPAKPAAPSELVQDVAETDNQYRPKKIDLPDGPVNEAFSSLPFLANIGPSHIRISMEAGNNIIANFLRVLFITLGDDAEKYINPVKRKLIPALKEAIYNGLVTTISSVSDVYNPTDRYVEVYNRFQLSHIDPSLNGYAKMYIACRISPNKGILSVRGIKKYFEIVGLKPNKPAPPTNQSPPPSTKTPKDELAEEYDDDPDHGQYDDYMDQYDYPDADY
jgi:hypothetical protein